MELEDRTKKRISELKTIGLKLMPGFSMGYRDPEKKIFINFDQLDIAFYEDEKWYQEFDKAKKLMCPELEQKEWN